MHKNVFHYLNVLLAIFITSYIILSVLMYSDYTMSEVFKYCSRRAAFLKVQLYVLWLRLWVALRYPNKSARKTKFKQLRYAAEKEYLSRYLYAVKPLPTTATDTPKIIWTCWWQGEDNLPPVVKRSIQSIRRYCPDYELRIITSDNMRNYIELPAYIMQKHQNGCITRTQLSDLLRIALLSKYGGFWMDATVFLTAPLPQPILKAPFFAFHCRDLYQGQSWFLKASAQDSVIVGLKNFMFEYWKHENKMLNYFLVYIAFDMVVSANKGNAEQWAQTPLIYDDCYELADNYFAAYSPQKWAEIKAKTSIHKLSWKYKKEPTPNSFLQQLLDGKLED